ncbi:MAG TPA: hypothetical protein VIM85_00090 [Pseudomonadales bacterium]
MNLQIKKSKILSLVLLGSLFLTNIADADISVVVHKNSPLSAITLKEGKRIFLGVTKKMPNGQDIEIIDQSGNSDLKEDFYMALTNKNSAQINSRWAGLVFSGQAIPPKVANGNQGVKAFLQSNTNGIGYIDSKEVDGSVKSILTIKN